ncbi:MAG: hypothetical protein J6A28_01210 [Clostridia bacterium]|nr:hypothetical protein [Clostridia bacterium]
MFSNEYHGYSRREVDGYIARMKGSYQKAIMDERLKILDAEKKVMELRKKEKELEEREQNIKSMLDSFRKMQAEGNSNIDILRIEQLKIIYLQMQELMKELSAKYPGIMTNSSYKKLSSDIQSILAKSAMKKDQAATDNDSMRILLSKMQEKRGHEGGREIRVERSSEFKDRSIFLKPVTDMQLNEGEEYENLVDKFLASKPVDEQPKAMPIVSNGFDLKEAVTPKDDLSEIMKAFDFFGGNDEEG